MQECSQTGSAGNATSSSVCSGSPTQLITCHYVMGFGDDCLPGALTLLTCALQFRRFDHFGVKEKNILFLCCIVIQSLNRGGTARQITQNISRFSIDNNPYCANIVHFYIRNNVFFSRFQPSATKPLAEAKLFIQCTVGVSLGSIPGPTFSL